MIGLDTNILVRLITREDEAQWRAAAKLVNDLAPREKAVVNIIVLVELAWTLRRTYKFGPEEVVRALRRLTEHPQIEIPDKDVLREALHRTRETGGDLPDHLIAVLNRSYGCRTTFTFDEEAARNDDFTPLSLPT